MLYVLFSTPQRFEHETPIVVVVWLKDLAKMSKVELGQSLNEG